MKDTNRTQPEAINLRADLHGRALEYVSTGDRLWFAAHPEASCYQRPPGEHEWCLPAGDGTCAQMFPGRVVAVHVTQLGEGLRAREPMVAR